MNNRDKLRSMAIDDLLKDIQSRADKFDVCIMTLIPNGRLLCPWYNESDCERCLEDWLNEEKGEENNAAD